MEIFFKNRRQPVAIPKYYPVRFERQRQEAVNWGEGVHQQAQVRKKQEGGIHQSCLSRRRI
jgi:hypothetical protein